MEGSKLFVAIVGDGQWADFCNEFDQTEWLKDGRFQTNADRADHRDLSDFGIEKIFLTRPTDDLCAVFERLGLPFAPVRTPGELVHDVHLNASGGLIASAA